MSSGKLKFKGDAGSSSGTSKNTTAFNHVMGGKLKLKGDAEKPKKKKKREDEDDEPLELPDYSADPVVGTGKLTTSGVVVMGSDTDFAKELDIGDTLLVTVVDRFRNTEADESRVVNMVLGKTSLNIEAPFTCDVTSAASFMFVKRKPDVEALKAARHEEKRRKKALEAESSTMTYKVVAPRSGPWQTWKTVTEKCDGMSREDQLVRRAKEKADRFCK